MSELPEDPVEAHVRSALPASRRAVLAAVQAALRTPADAGPFAPPAWLHTRHHTLLQRLLRGLRQCRVALLAAPTGHGKSYLALAAAVQLQQPALLLVPAALRPQWQRLARDLGLAHELLTHERISRTVPSLPDTGLVIVDEAHRFRSPATQRYRHLASLLPRRPVLLLTATPVVNRLDDLLALLLLAAPDDALRRDGVPSLHRLLTAGTLHPALARLVHCPPGGARPPVQRVTHRPPLDATRADLLAGLGAVAFSKDAGVAALLRALAVRALTSSIAAFDAVLARCERLHRHAQEAAAAGHPLSRAALLRATHQLDDQLLLWALLPADDAPADLDTDDLPRIAALRAACAAADDTDVAAVLAVIPPAVPTIVFTSWRATAQALARRLGARTAWVTGTASGIGLMRLPREAVLAHFRTATADPRAPRVLVATDVAAEGLDLRRLRAVVHADLPWTPTRLAQREGRARRAGLTESVAVHMILPPTALERQLRQLGILRRKQRLARSLHHTVRLPPWELESPVLPVPDGTAERERSRIGVPRAVRTNPTDGARDHPIVCRIRLPCGAGEAAVPPSALCVLLDESGDATLTVVHPDTPPTDDTPALRDALRTLVIAVRREASRSRDAGPRRDGSVHAPRGPSAWVLPAITAELRRRLALRQAADWSLEPATLESRLLAERIRVLARHAVRLRDATGLQLLDRALRWCARAPTAGDRYLQQQLLAAPDLGRALAAADGGGRLSVPPPPPAPALRLVAICCFVPSAAAATFGPCQLRARSSSTSTARSSTASASSSTATITSPASTA